MVTRSLVNASLTKNTKSLIAAKKLRFNVKMSKMACVKDLPNRF